MTDNNEMLYSFKKRNSELNKKESFNRALYKKENDNSLEYNSGENLVDTTGYIPLAELLTRCGLKGVQLPDWNGIEQGVDFKTDKFSDKIEAQTEINEIIENAVKKSKKGKENSPLSNEITTIEKKVDTIPESSSTIESSTEK